MADEERLICASKALTDAGPGVRFEVSYFDELTPAFVVRWQGRVYGYLNRCAHMPMELDWLPGVFFGAEGNDLVCSTHGAVYAVADGRCLGGPCGSTPLVRLVVAERDGAIYFLGIEDDG
ncbi:MAG: Rieske 2Fe-2S domain-containing protein [bacterium]|jgi:nitrite reductase/ring-hydroxylating ferredoxin subunit